MPKTDSKPQADQAGLNRLIFLSDGVTAIAITLMALQIRVPESVLAGDLRSALIALRPTLTSYVLSFLVVGTYWIEHHRMFKLIRRDDVGLVWLNMLFLFLIVLVPFPTDLIDRFEGQQLAVILYAGLLGATGLALAGLWRHATCNHRLVDPDLDPELIRRGGWLRLAIPLAFLVSIPVAFLDAWAAMAVWPVCFLLVLFIHFRS